MVQAQGSQQTCWSTSLESAGVCGKGVKALPWDVAPSMPEDSIMEALGFRDCADRLTLIFHLTSLEAWSIEVSFPTWLLALREMNVAWQLGIIHPSNLWISTKVKRKFSLSELHTSETKVHRSNASVPGKKWGSVWSVHGLCQKNCLQSKCAQYRPTPFEIIQTQQILRHKCHEIPMPSAGSSDPPTLRLKISAEAAGRPSVPSRDHLPTSSLCPYVATWYTHLKHVCSFVNWVFLHSDGLMHLIPFHHGHGGLKIWPNL